jgi:hypothetical protein
MGLLLDLDVGSLRFFKNGDEQERHYGAGSVTGPVVAALQMDRPGSVRLLPNAQPVATLVRHLGAWSSRLDHHYKRARSCLLSPEW